MSGFRSLQRLKLGKLTVTPPIVARQNPEGSIIILHGSCDTGSGMKSWLDQIRESEFSFHNYRILYPTAPIRPYTLMNGEKTGIWFDRLSLGPRVPEDLLSIEATAHELKELIQEESKNTGVPLGKMIVGGFSMGGIMALHLAYRFQSQIAGVFALSSFLPMESAVYNTLKEKTKPVKKPVGEKIKKKGGEGLFTTDRQKRGKLDVSIGTPTSTPTLDKILKKIKLEEGANPPQFPRLFMSNGYKDPLTLYPWARTTFSALRRHGIEGHFYTHQTGHHGIEKNQLTLLHGWIQKVLTDKDNPNGSTPKPKMKKTRRRSVNDEACEPVGRL